MPTEADGVTNEPQPEVWGPRDDLIPPNGGDIDGPTAVTAAAATTPAAPTEPLRLCSACRKPMPPAARFCSQCGADQNPALAAIEQRRNSQHHQEEWSHIRNLVWFYAIYLASTLPLYWLPEEVTATAMLVIDAVDAGIILTYWWVSQARLGDILRPSAALLRPTVIGCGLLLVLLPLNLGYHALLQWIFTLDPANQPSLTQPFELAGYGLGVQLFCIALMPAIWEEIAFRGLIQGRLESVVGRTEALWLTAALFAIIHASWLSLPYLFLLGLVLGILRQRSQSLLPGMVLHGVHNAAVILM